MLRLDMRWGMAMALIVLALAVNARGQRLLEADGVELLGEAQLVMSGGGTCNVLESDTAYDRKKENHGAPMDIWRLEFSVRNGSGRWLDHLIARFQIDSEWPDCTNWDGPGAGQFQSLEWADSIGHIQESGRNVVAPGQTLTETKFFIVLRGDPEPRFSNWSMDFDFAAAPPTADFATGAPSSPAAATAAQESLFWQSIMNSTNPAEFEAYLAQFPNGIFRALAEARRAALRAPAGATPTAAGRSAPAVERLDRPSGAPAGSTAPKQQEGSPSRISDAPKCAGKPKGAACWMELVNQPQCYVWNPNLQPDQTVTWTAACAGGSAQGTGTLTWVRGDQETDEAGLLQDGQKTGRWVDRYADGSGVAEGPYVEGERHGDWVLRGANGTLVEAHYVEGERHGDWIIRDADGRVEEGPFVADERHGDWIVRWADGRVEEGPFVEGQMQGRWVVRYADGHVEEGPYVEDQRHGDWVVRFANGNVGEGPYVEGQMHGDWVVRRADGTVENVTFRNGERVNNGAAQQAERVSLLFWSAEPTEDHGRFRIYIDGQELVNRNVRGAWRGDPPTCNYREEHPEGVPNFVLVTMDPGQYRIRAVAERRSFYVLDAQGFGSGVAFAIEDTLDLTLGCHVYELVRTN